MAVVIGTGSFLLFISFTVNMVAMMVPHWYVDNKVSQGLWANCSCDWHYTSIPNLVSTENTGQVFQTGWFKAVQWLYVVGVFLLTVATCLQFILVCCSETDDAKMAPKISSNTKKRAKATTAAGGIILIAAMLIAISIVIFGVSSHEDMSLRLGLAGDKRYDWAMWVAVAGFGVSLATALTFLVHGSRMYN